MLCVSGNLMPSWVAVKLAETDVKNSPRSPTRYIGNKWFQTNFDMAQGSAL